MAIGEHASTEEERPHDYHHTVTGVVPTTATPAVHTPTFNRAASRPTLTSSWDASLPPTQGLDGVPVIGHVYRYYLRRCSC